MKLLGLAFGLLLALFTVSSAMAQDGPVVTGRADKASVKAGATVTLTLFLEVKQGYHINGHAVDDSSMIPTKVTMAAVPGFKLLRAGYPRPKMLKFAFSEGPIPVYEKTVRISLTIQAAADASAGLHKLPVTVSYQACDNEACLMPEELVVRVQVNVTR